MGSFASPSAGAVVKDIRRATRKQYGAEVKIRIVLEGLRGEDSIAELCRREGLAQSLYYVWSKEVHSLMRYERNSPKSLSTRTAAKLGVYFDKYGVVQCCAGAIISVSDWRG